RVPSYGEALARRGPGPAPRLPSSQAPPRGAGCAGRLVCQRPPPQRPPGASAPARNRSDPAEEKMAATQSPTVVDAVRRELEIDDSGDHDADGRPLVRTTATLTTNVARSPAQLWPLLTDPARLATWF